MDREVIKKYGVSYLRVSSAEQVQNFSLSNQQDYTASKATSESYEIKKIFSDEGQSAKTLNRPKLQELIKYVLDKKNNISAIFVYRYDRLSRNQLDFLGLRHLFSQHGISIISATETSGDSPEVRFMQGILSGVAELDNENKSSKVIDGMRKRFLSGYTNQHPPLGYIRQEVDGKTIGIPDTKTFILLQKLWYKVDAEKWTLDMVKKDLEKLLYRSFHKQTISKMFSNKYYMGIITSKSFGEAQGKHQAMVDQETFYRVRQLITGRRKEKNGIRKDMCEELPLRGHLLCPQCGRNLTGGGSTSKSGKKVYYYICNQRKEHKTHEVNAERFNNFFYELLKNITVKPNWMRYIAEHLKEQYQLQFNDLIESSKVIQKELNEIANMLETLPIKHLKGVYSDEEFIKLKDTLELQYATQKGLLSEKQIDKLDIQTILEWNTYYLTHVAELWLNADIELKHRIESSILPKKWVCDKSNYRTPEIGRQYKLNDLYKQQIDNKYPQVTEYRTLLEAFRENYLYLSPYISLA